MKGAAARGTFSLGFLTVVQHREQGLFGGLLLLDRAGRPLEFHCTAPVKPNRAQEILYGPTLKPFLYGEQIGNCLVSKTRLAPLVVCTDCEPALAVREFTEYPVALVLPPEAGEFTAEGENATSEAAGPQRAYRLEGGHGSRLAGPVFLLGRHRLAVAAGMESDRQVIADRLGETARTFDLAEPFQRIREAIDLARSGG